MTKSWKITRMADGAVAAIVGDIGKGRVLLAWYDDGADPDKWPQALQTEEGFSPLILADTQMLVEFENLAVPLVYPRSQKMAWGSGHQIALGAMAAGATAAEAVKIASQYDIYTGHGVDTMEPEGRVLADALAWGIVTQSRVKRRK